MKFSTYLHFFAHLDPPEITQSPISLYADEGGFALFRCEYSGSHKHSSVRWYKDGLPVKGPRFNEKKGYLNITSVSPSDQGDYICQVITKPHPAVYSNPASLTVKGNNVNLITVFGKNSKRRLWNNIYT